MNGSVVKMGKEEKGSMEHKQLGDKITQLRDIIKRKYKRFKQGNLDTEKMLEKSYKPLITELRKNSDKKKSPLEIKKEEPTNEDTMEDELNSRTTDTDQSVFDPTVFSSPQSKTLRVPPSEDVFESSNDEDRFQHDMTSVLASEHGMASASQYIARQFTNPITKHYMEKLMKDLGGKNQKIDHTYGPRYDGDILMIGDKALKFDDDGSIRIDDVTYGHTKGLYELIFKRIPDDELYNDQDLEAYKDILKKTNAHKRGYNYQGNINRNASIKYKTVIAKLFPKALYSGKGRVRNKRPPSLMKSFTDNREIVYWNDANELCDRLRLLVVSAETGNNSHTNEIISIIEELKEANIISGEGNAKFLSLVQ